MNKSKKETFWEKLTGKGRENIPNFAFRLMTFIMKIMDFLVKHSEKNFESLGLKEGQVVVDYGCGPARYVVNASKAVGKSGKVYAADIHPLAIAKVKQMIEKYRLTNVETVRINGYVCDIPDNSADIIYALDMFHMIAEPNAMLKEFTRILKPEGKVIIEDGHQPRTETKNKIIASQYLTIVDENEKHVLCKL